QRVPAVSTMSSTSTQVLPATSPMMFITVATFAFGRRLSMIARSASSRRLAMARARTTPPTSGLTTTMLSVPCARQMSASSSGGADHDQVVGAARAPDVGPQQRRGIDVVDGDVEEALALVGVQLDRQQAVGAGGGEHAGGQLGRDRHPRGAHPAVLAGVAEVRH